MPIALPARKQTPRSTRWSACAVHRKGRGPCPADAADRFFAATDAHIRHGGTRAHYAEGQGYVQMPFETFKDAESHAATLAHELTHWTKHMKRLPRDLGRVRYGDEGYAREEL